MKTFLKVLSLIATAAVPATLALEGVGVNLPASCSVGSAFVFFVISMVSLIAATDYARTPPLRAAKLPTATKAANPLAA